MSEKIIECRAICAMHGYGILTLTNEFIAWNKSAVNLIAFGVFSTLSDNFVGVPLSKILCVERYTFIGGGGVKVILKTGEAVKFSIKPKRNFDVIYNYLTNRIHK